MNMQGLGDWTVDREKFPRGLGPLVERVTKLGMAFGLGREPEMVNPDSDLYRAHPDWAYHFANRSRTESRNQLVLNLAVPRRGGLGLRNPRPTIERTGHLFHQMGHEPAIFRAWMARKDRWQPGAGVGRPCPQPLRILDHLRAAHPQVASSHVRAGAAGLTSGFSLAPSSSGLHTRRLGPHCDARRFLLRGRSHGDGGLGD